MSKYVMSDLHGCYEEFIKMLELIKFSDEDHLYILGDVIDRGPSSLKIIDYIVTKPNITLLLGNHEQMYVEWFETGYPYDWFSNGGDKTFEELTTQKPIEFQYELYRYFRKLPRMIKVDKFILVHAGVYLPSNYKEFTIDELLKDQTLDYNIWGRSHVGKYYELPNDYKIVCGHTPVQNIINCEKPSDVQIVSHGSYIYIDCGGVFKDSFGKHACLRLDDMEEFYV